MKSVNEPIPASAREQAYDLLATRSPTAVVIDTDLPHGTWLIIRSATVKEREAMTGSKVSKKNGE